MYIYHALINALSTHIIQINLNTIFCTYVEDGPTRTIGQMVLWFKKHIFNAVFYGKVNIYQY